MNKVFFILVFLAALSLGLSGCGDFSFVRVKEVTDATINKEVISAYKPVALLIHRNLSSSGAHQWGPILERFAKAYPDDMLFAHYDLSKNGEWFRKSGQRFVGVVHLYNRGKLVSSASASMPDERSRLAQIFLLVNRYVLPNKKFDGFRSTTLLKTQYFSTDVLEAEKPVVVAFDRCSGGG